MTKKLIVLICFFFLASKIFLAQTLNQTLKGRVLDKVSQISLPGATVIIEGTDPIIGGASDMDGYFRLENVPVGRYNLVVSYIGYKSVTIPEVLVSSGKEKIISIELIETVNKLDEVVIKAYVNKDKPLNPMASISSRSFSVEETRRYAGGLDDPSRMASSFAGVTTTHMGDNSIIVRGNAPKGVLWRLEGVDIPNPSHFSGTHIQGGGFFTIFSSQVLTNSDFYTGAFPAEYGNALAGVFDMKLRTGNKDKREHTFQFGTLGIDLSSEGPFVKGEKATYLFNYRYATYAILANLIPGSEMPKYQDLSFKLNFPTRKAGTFSLWGVGGYDYITKKALKDPIEWEYKEDREEQELKMIPAVTGITHKIILNEKTYMHSSLSTTIYNSMFDSKWAGDDLVIRDNEFIDMKNQKYILSTFINHKSSARHTNRTGIRNNHMLFDVVLRQSPDLISPLQEFVNESGNTGLIQTYSQSRFNLSDNFTINAGVHAQYFLLNKNYSVEPRLSLKYNINNKHSVSAGYGRHSQLEDIKIYLSKQDGPTGVTQANKNLDFSKADHFVLGYDFLINKHLRLKVEPYFQYLSNIPVIPDSSYSLINFKQDWFFNDSLVNKGTGTNIGIDFTLEHFLQNNYYWMITGSVFNSRYTGGDGIQRNSVYNRKYILNALYGREFFVGKRKGKMNILSVNAKVTIMGGEYQTPYLEDESQKAKMMLYDFSRPYELKDPFTYYVDLTVTYTKNKPKYTGTWALQIKNLTQSATKYDYAYSYKKDKVVENYLTSIIPTISYKIEF